MLRLICGYSLLLGASLGMATPAQKSVMVSKQALRRDIETLASDAFEGRFPGTDGEEKTVSLLHDRFASLGLKPVVGNSFFQEVPLFGSKPSATPKLVARLGESDMELNHGEHFTLNSHKGDKVVSIEDSDLIFVGYGIQAPDYAWDDLKNTDLSGKTVLVLWGDPGAHGPDKSLFSGDAMSRYGMGFSKVETLKKTNPAAVFLIHEQSRAGYPFDAIASQGLQYAYKIDDPQSRAESPAATGLISRSAVADLLARVGLDIGHLEDVALKRDFVPVDAGIRLSIDLAVDHKPLKTRNVVAMLEGTQRPEEFVVYTAHWDHIGTSDSEQDAIYNGAVDNATGTAMLMEMARLFTETVSGPERSVIFLATTAEEQGLLGAHYFVDHAPLPLAQIQGVFNMDAAFPFGSFRGMTVPGLGNSELEYYLEKAAASVDRVLLPDPQPQMGAFFRSDHYPFIEHGVPAIFAVGGPTQQQIEENPGILQKFIDYSATRYHKPEDEYDVQSWDLDGIIEDVLVMYRAGLAVARDRKRPNWFIDSEFRSARDIQVMYE